MLSGVIRAIQQWPKGCNLGRNRVKRGQIPSISGPMRPEDPGTRVPGSIQHLPWTGWDWLWLPGWNCRRYSNRKPVVYLWVPLARRESGPLSPGHCFPAASDRTMTVQCSTGCGVLGGVYPARNGMGLAGHQGHYYQGVPPPPPSLLLLCSLSLFPVTVH